MATEKGKEVKDEKISKTRPRSISKETKHTGVTKSPQTYPSKLEIQVDEPMLAFKSLETQVGGIVQKSYEDQTHSEMALHQEEIQRLTEKNKELGDQLRKERRDKERIEKELRSANESLDKNKNESQRSKDDNDRMRRLENEMKGLKEGKDRDKLTLKSQEETIGSLRKMLESVKADLRYVTERSESGNKAIKYLQERNVQLVEKSDKQ